MRAPTQFLVTVYESKGALGADESIRLMWAPTMSAPTQFLVTVYESKGALGADESIRLM
jgi:hypothetical protein